MNTPRGADHSSRLDDADDLQIAALAESAETSKRARERDDHVRAIFGAVQEPPEENARRAATRRLAGMYLNGTLPGTMIKGPDLRTAAKLYEAVGAKDELLGVTDLMCRDVGRRFSVTEVAKLYIAVGAKGAERLARVTASYIDHGALDPAAYAVAIEFLDAANDTEGLIRLANRLVRESSGEQNDHYWDRAIDAYRRAKADDKLAALADNALENSGDCQLAFHAYKAINGRVPAPSVQLLVAFADRLLEPPSMPNFENALEALIIAGASKALVALGDRLTAEHLLSHAVKAYTAAGAVDKLLAIGEELFASFDKSGRSAEYQGSLKAIKAATQLALESPSA